MEKPKHNSEGHRKRLRNKFLNSGLNSFHDYEIIELLLTLGTPRKDCKEPAKEAIKKFKSLRGVLEADLCELQEVKGIGHYNAFGIKLVKEVAEELLKEKVSEKPVITSSRDLFDYLYLSMRDLKRETFKVIFLNSKNRILEIQNLFEGTLNSSSVYPREVLSLAMRYSAASLIFVHNHPSGDPQPSEKDKEVTGELVAAGNIMKIRVLDHIIVGDNRYYSFADEGLIEKYNLEFLNKKR
ncbi:MAG: hypothetical protein A3C43_04095 [Candidatus Schekmanbacteria bacterium RIFCSPHIGHO2_02_FULL_38_11]|uniref:MPN domain-containing protein n=1 Tax=Candidatus Schekmanbacteria bacterium RIFCSPLOWO2_12_FULL_38_15 TaxID=1817883 RepID=A0A1F7SH11_9BACT|nr:MAG: hypothetical protein A2043_04290 [Candidatus Schekmanbacteria bacterium GWA2_38_9]OGL49739.1 MAG: hypothetical protein A3H37_01790 [Candidatus Schekmanbacteria bacterium RIFCSPLOWO2_02_FULL_38_14]OGL53093.1 MAG: hypothetical protein A3G31_09345 [Candidatus Schekmanbacteria bacterium RIFCSPLOWO2_12_FULL_38_15]OGL53795.1 MAG: hypothetical protein A3C43_04095 [Candidatus Schekmanbacteria bacterium RIFCSPHIGHO2_02_FULL_38_11]